VHQRHRPGRLPLFRAAHPAKSLSAIPKRGLTPFAGIEGDSKNSFFEQKETKGAKKNEECPEK
jgi:hypothetical protein